MLTIGLTGGIASGKSAVSRLFEEEGVPVIDSDLVSRDLVRPGEPALREIEREFGSAVIDSTGKLDRPAMRDIIFRSQQKRRLLEDILHPRIRDRIGELLASLGEEPYAIVVIPLLVESRYPIRVDRVLVVDTDATLQRERLMQRDGIDRARAMAILRAQSDRNSRLAVADDVIVNDSDMASLREKVRRLHAAYLEMAQQETADPR
ncbi:MAG: dephospho-CoA kinase [Gammaproteobacteria bacterium]